MIDQPIDAIDEAALQRLVDNQFAEGRDLEFKRELPGGGDEASREFLADVGTARQRARSARAAHSRQPQRAGSRDFQKWGPLLRAQLHAPVGEEGRVGSYALTHRTGRSDSAFVIGGVRQHNGEERRIV